MRIPITEHIAGTTVRVTWISSGAAPTGMASMLRDRADAVVNTATAVDSGNGFWYALHTLPNTNGWYVNEWQAVIAANTYISRQFIRAIRPEVD